MSWCKKGEYDAQNIPKIRAMWVQVGRQSKQTCPGLYVAGKFVTKPMSYVAAQHLYRFKLGTKLIQSLHPYLRRSFYRGGGVAISKQPRREMQGDAG